MELRSLSECPVDEVGLRSIGVMTPCQVGLDRHGGFLREPGVAERAEDRLATEIHDVAVTSDARSGPQDVGQLVSVHRLVSLVRQRSMITARSSSVSRPANGEF